MAQVDWEQIKIEYITSAISQRKLAEKHNLSYNTLRRMAEKYKWAEGRRKYSAKVAAKTIEKTAEKRSNKLAKLSVSADLLCERIETALKDPDGLFIEMDNGKKIFNTKAVRNLSGAIRDLTATIRNLHDIPTKAEKEAMKIARERLELEKKKAETDKAIEDGLGVVLIPEVLEEDE